MTITMTARLARLVRYPVKGFAGHDLASAVVHPGEGLPYDRMLAISNGNRHVEPGRWNTSHAFVRLLKNTDLPRYGTAFVDAEEGDSVGTHHAALRLVSPAGQTLRVRLTGADVPATDLSVANDLLADWFPSGRVGPPRLVASRQGLWDHEDAVLSLINLETVAELAGTAGRHVDPLRFRANLYLSELPAWSEFAMVGRRIRLGDVELEVLRPTDRCRATVVDPATGATDLNIPSLLGAAYGHLFCGLYARVVTGGLLRPGQSLHDVGPAAGATVDATTVSTAPPAGQWPRPAVVTDRLQHGAAATSYWLRDPLAGLRPAPRPGQHLRVHAADENGPVWRCYTISGTDGDRLRISVGNAGPEGRMSRLIHGCAEPGTTLLITGPFGDFGLDEPDGCPETADERPILMASAGIGITPIAAMLRALAAEGSRRPVRWLHVARGCTDLSLWDEARASLGRLPTGQARLFLTGNLPPGARPMPARDDEQVAVGRPTAAVVAALVDEVGAADLSVYLCGPPGFLVDIRTAVLHAGVSPSSVRHEVFVSPRRSAGPATAAPLPGPFRVRFTAAGEDDDPGVDTVWRAADGSLLDTAEAAGLTLPAGCRAGACGTCSQPIAAGSSAYLLEPVLVPRSPAVLLCCAVPTSDITITT